MGPYQHHFQIIGRYEGLLTRALELCPNFKTLIPSDALFNSSRARAPSDFFGSTGHFHANVEWLSPPPEAFKPRSEKHQPLNKSIFSLSSHLGHCL